jgi:hypothetical protein
MGCSIFTLQFLAAVFATATPGAATGSMTSGALIEVVNRPPMLMMLTSDKLLKIPVADGAEIMRSHVGKDPAQADISELEIGDYILAALDATGTAVTVTSTYRLLAGEVRSVHGSRVLLSSGELVDMNPSARLLGPNNETITLSSLARGEMVSIKTDPSTDEGWRLIRGVQTVPSAPTPDRPTINSVSHSAQTVLRSGEIVHLKIIGTPGLEALCEVGNAKVQLTETSPGTYEGIWTAPSGKAVSGVAVVGTLRQGKQSSKRVQAARLLSVGSGSEASDGTTSVQRGSGPVATAPRAEPSPRNTVAAKPSARPSPSIITRPADELTVQITRPKAGEKLVEYMLVNGKTAPGARVKLKIDYANNLSGLLKLTGIVAEEEVVADAQGLFSSSHIRLSGIYASKGLDFLITATATDRSGRESRPDVVRTSGRR